MRPEPRPVYDRVIHGLESEEARLRHLADVARAALRYYGHARDESTVGLQARVPATVASRRIEAWTGHLDRLERRIRAVETRLRILRHARAGRGSDSPAVRADPRPPPARRPTMASRAA